MFQYSVYVTPSLLIMSIDYRLEYISFRWKNCKAVGLLNSALNLGEEIWSRCEPAMLKVI